MEARRRASIADAKGTLPNEVGSPLQAGNVESYGIHARRSVVSDAVNRTTGAMQNNHFTTTTHVVGTRRPAWSIARRIGVLGSSTAGSR
jgi:hypothetical protein